MPSSHCIALHCIPRRTLTAATLTLRHTMTSSHCIALHRIPKDVDRFNNLSPKETKLGELPALVTGLDLNRYVEYGAVLERACGAVLEQECGAVLEREYGAVLESLGYRTGPQPVRRVWCTLHCTLHCRYQDASKPLTLHRYTAPYYDVIAHHYIAGIKMSFRTLSRV